MKARALLVPGLCLLLAVTVFLIYGQTLGHAFLNVDDDEYITRNPEVRGGLTLHGIAWAFTHHYSHNWHPLTWISHMVDCQLYGLHPAGHHLTNLLLHAAVAILLFLVLRGMTGSLWRSAFVAALFAVHPLRVESVAWAAERKDLLSGFFLMLTLAAYLRYVRRPPRLGNYLLVMFCFALGLMSKPTLVTVPFLLLLLDYWPLRRFPERETPGKVPLTTLFWEKVPLVAFSAAACVATVIAQSDMIVPLEQLPFTARLGNAAVSYVAYLRQMAWPSGLGMFYPWNGRHTGWIVALSCLLLIAVSAGGWIARKQRPYLLVGWAWYLGMLLPMIGLVQVGAAQRADRYTYLSGIGIAILVTWAIADLPLGSRRRWLLGASSAVVLAALALVAYRQASYWQDSVSIWSRTLSVTPHNPFAEEYLGRALFLEGRFDEAIFHLERVDAASPRKVSVYSVLGAALLQQGHPEKALGYLQNAADLAPDNPAVRSYLAVALCQNGQIDQGIVQWQKLIALAPGDATAHYNLGKALLERGRDREGIAQFQEAARIDPGNPSLAAALQKEIMLYQAGRKP